MLMAELFPEAISTLLVVERSCLQTHVWDMAGAALDLYSRNAGKCGAFRAAMGTCAGETPPPSNTTVLCSPVMVGSSMGLGHRSDKSQIGNPTQSVGWEGGGLEGGEEVSWYTKSQVGGSCVPWQRNQ